VTIEAIDDGAREANGREARADAVLARAAERARRQRLEGRVGTALQLASYASILLLWLLAARTLGAVVPGPIETFEFIGRELERGTLLAHLWVTTQRVLIAFVAAMVAGVAIGAAMGSSRRLDDLLQGWLVMTLTVPRILLFVVAYLTIGLTDRALVLALVITVVPTIVVAIREGTRALDASLLEMATAFRRTRAQAWRHVILPQLTPFIIGTARGALALAWKMVVLGELIGRTSGVGYQISFYFQFFNMTGILAYGVTMMVLLAAVDLGVMGVVQRLAFRWRAPVRVNSTG